MRGGATNDVRDIILQQIGGTKGASKLCRSSRIGDLLGAERATAQPTGSGTEDPNNWPQYYRTSNGGRYSPLEQINKTNVGKLKVAGDVTHGTQETPIVIDGVIYSISRRRTGDRGKIYAQAYALISNPIAISKMTGTPSSGELPLGRASNKRNAGRRRRSPRP